MIKKIVLIGKSCSGKSTLANILEKYGLKSQLSTTSRPMRNNEKNGIDYNFVSKETFMDMMSKNEFIETDVFNEWYYGLTYKDFNDADVLILTVRGLQKYLNLFPREDFLIVYIDTSIKLRKERIALRGDKDDSASRRWMADDIDFECFEQWGSMWDIKISTQSNTVVSDLIEFILQKRKKSS